MHVSAKATAILEERKLVAPGQALGTCSLRYGIYNSPKGPLLTDTVSEEAYNLRSGMYGI